MMSLAGNNLVDQVAKLPGWEQSAIGLGLCVAAVVIYKVAEELDNSFVGWISVVVGLAGISVLGNGLFG